MGGRGLDLSSSESGQVAGSCGHGNEHFGVNFTFRATQLYRFCRLIFIQLYYIFRLPISAIIM